MLPLKMSSIARFLVAGFLTTLFTASAAQTNTTKSSIPSSSYTVTGNTGNSFTIAVNVPSPAQDNDLYFHISGPAQQWIAFGFGTGMAGALIFVTYSSATGNNVTVSPRLGLGHSQPLYTSAVTVDLLAGTGVNNDSYVVNARCTNCRSWSDGSVAVTSTSQPMIWAVADGDNLNTDDVQTTIVQHADHGFFDLNLVEATGAGGVPSGLAGGGTGGAVVQDDTDMPRGIHAVFMVGSFLIGFPAGYLFLRVFDRIWIHYTVQSIATFAVLLGMGSGIALSRRNGISPNLNAPHQIIGFIIVVFVIATWTMGFLGHRLYKKNGVPAIPMKVHRFAGPGTMALGLANCIVGFHFAGDNFVIIGFVVLTTIMIIVVSALVFITRRRRSKRQAMNTPAAQNFRQGQMESQYAGTTGPGQEEGVLLEPYGGARPQPYTLPSYHSDGGYDAPQGPPPGRL